MSNNSLLDKKILEVLKMYGFSDGAKGTEYYKEVIKAVVLYLRISSRESERNNLKEQLLSKYSVFYFLLVKDIENVSLEDFHKEIELASKDVRISKDARFNNYMFFAYVIGSYVLNIINDDENILKELASYKYIREKQ